MYRCAQTHRPEPYGSPGSLTDDGFVHNGHPGDAVKTSRIVTGVAAHALLSMDAHEVLIGFFMVCLAGELGLLVFGQIGLGILSDTERSHELSFSGMLI